MFTRSSLFRVAALGGLLVAIPAGLAFAHGPGGPGGRGGPDGHRFHAAQTADDVRERMGFVADRALDKVDATAEQRVAIDAILDDAAPRAFETKQEIKALRKELRAEFTKATLDDGKIEKLRKQGVSLADEKSKDLTDTMLQIAEVLTPEQRAILGEEIAKRAAAFEDDEQE